MICVKLSLYECFIIYEFLFVCGLEACLFVFGGDPRKTGAAGERRLCSYGGTVSVFPVDDIYHVQ